MSFVRPMLACTMPDIDSLVFPFYASPKLDGVRCLIVDGVAMSRSMKPIKNRYIQQVLFDIRYDGLDGELIVGSPTADDVYRTTVSGVMSEDGQPNFTFHVFDVWSMDGAAYSTRLAQLRGALQDLGDNHPVRPLDHAYVRSAEELLALERRTLQAGYEGLILRRPDSLYKRGRATQKSRAMMKMKRFVDAEAEILWAEELMHNANEAKKNELGYTERSSHKANQEPMGTLGALVCRTPEGVEFKIGTGFDAAERLHLWNNRHTLKGKLVKYKFFPVGIKDKPRHPVYLGMRDPDDR